MQPAQSTQTNIYQELDDFFSARGFTIETTGSVIPRRTWKGTWGNRSARVLCAPRYQRTHVGEDISSRQYIGQEFSLEMTTSVFTRIVMVPHTAPSIGALENYFMGKVGLYPFSGVNASYPRLRTRVHDEAWATEYLNVQHVQQQINEKLLPESIPAGTFSIQPGTIQYRMRNSMAEMTAEKVEGILKSIEGLADLAEGLGPPAKRAELSWLEKKMKGASPMKIALVLMGTLIGILFFGSLLLVVVVFFGFQNIWVFPVFGGLVAFLYWKFLKSK